jgi:glucuronoarabinoxylan endo-1,4-beta-xylanase
LSQPACGLRPRPKAREITRVQKGVWLITGLTAVAGCGPVPGETATVSEQWGLESGDASIELATSLQPISGFGASSAWTEPDLAASLADQLFSIDQGIGLSLLRVHIQPDGDTAERATAQKAQARGARVWAAPWSPPAAWKSPPLARPDVAPTVNGGTLLPEYYQAWANSLAAFARSMQDAGTPLAYLSAQNEPTYETALWETCVYQPAELVTFVRDFLGPALADQGVSTRVLAPETQDWFTLGQYGDAILADASASAFVGAIATHGYGGSAYAYTAPAQNGKEFWQTELDDGLHNDSYDAGMDSALVVAAIIHRDLTVASVNAWHYWWISGIRGRPTNAALTDGTALSRRAYVLGNYSKFVRPGFVRVNATDAPQAGVMLSAYRRPDGPEVAIVAINQNSTEVPQRFVLDSGDVSRVVPWVTSDAAALERQADVAVVEGAFDAVLPARSVTTFASGYVEAAPARPPAESTPSDGCGCRVGARNAAGAGSACVFGAIGVLAARRRRRTA